MQEIVSRHAPGVEVPPYIETKNIAVNVHYRKILDAAKQGDGSDLDKELSAYVNAQLAPIVEGTAFELRTGARTVETIITDTNKGHGLENLTKAMLDTGFEPSSIVFSGDDVCNHKDERGYGPGTDYYAMAVADRLSEEFGIPFFNMHTHHPEEETLLGKPMPKESSSPTNLPKGYPQPIIHTRMPYPWDNVGFMVKALGVSQDRKPMPQANGTGAQPKHDKV